jgi:hypothetical protein
MSSAERARRIQWAVSDKVRVSCQTHRCKKLLCHLCKRLSDRSASQLQEFQETRRTFKRILFCFICLVCLRRLMITDCGPKQAACEARGSVVDWGTMLQAGRSWVRFPMRSLDVSNCPNNSSRTMALGSTQPLAKWVPGIFLGDKRLTTLPPSMSRLSS